MTWGGVLEKHITKERARLLEKHIKEEREVIRKTYN